MKSRLDAPGAHVKKQFVEAPAPECLIAIGILAASYYTTLNPQHNKK